MPLERNKLRIGVVGAGHLGNHHLRKYRDMDHCEIVAVADVLAERAQSAAATFSCAAFADHKALLGQVDAVSIAVPTADHFKVARDFLAAGVDVLIEKPICATLAEADDLIALAREKRLVLQVGFVERFNPAVMALEKVLGKPMFIEAHRLHPFFERGTDVDVILDLMIHDLDIILKFVDSPVVGMEAVGVAVLSDKIDISNVRLSFASGCVANITASRISAKTMRKIRFFCPDGYHAVDCMKREVLSLGRIKTDQGQQIVPNAVEAPDHDPLEEEIRSFVNSAWNRSKPPVSGEDARKSLKLAIEIIQKMKTGEAI